MLKEIKIYLWFIFLYPLLRIKVYYIKKKFKRVCQQQRLDIYRQFPPPQVDTGIGYKNGKIYDYLNKEVINAER